MKNTAVFIALLYSVSSFARTCSDPPRTFIENINADHIIFAGTILEHLDIPIDSNALCNYYGVTKIKINHWYQNGMDSDTIYYANGHSAMCHESIDHFSIGEEVVIKAIKEVFYDPFMNDYMGIKVNPFYKELLKAL